MLAACGILWSDAKAVAQLSWTDTKLELHSDSTAPTLEGRFHFTNTGAAPVDIVRVVTSCGCTSASLAKTHIAPGEGGDILITYRRGGYTGLQQKQIEVETTGAPPTMLTLLVDIPKIVEIEPSFVTWRHSEAKTPKTLSVKLVAPGEITRLGVQSSDPAISADAQVVAAGQEYRLVVSPHGVSHFLHAVLTITCELNGKEMKTFTSYATVQPPL